MKKALIAMSGGVDSSVTAALMMEQGYECTGVNMRLFSGADTGTETRSCCSMRDSRDAAQVADAMGMPFFILPYTEEFHRLVIDHFVREYLQGRTPNPCIECNRHLKFDLLLKAAVERGCEMLATGHYARISLNEETGLYELSRAADEARDQSYVLYMLTQEQMARVRFPLGEYTKPDVRKLAAEYGFENAKKRDSQDICFVPDGRYARFIEEYLGKHSEPGNFVDTEGNVLGRHGGIIRYTTGQRRGLGISAPHPLYVKEIRPQTNEVVLGREEDVYTESFEIADYNCTSGVFPTGPFRSEVMTRYRQKTSPALVTPLSENRMLVKFDTPRRAVTPGQAAVLYDGDVITGGGTIV